jgi:hypothetical protein
MHALTPFSRRPSRSGMTTRPCASKSDLAGSPLWLLKLVHNSRGDGDH